MVKWVLFQGYKDGSRCTNQCDKHTYKQDERKCISIDTEKELDEI